MALLKKMLNKLEIQTRANKNRSVQTSERSTPLTPLRSSKINSPVCQPMQTHQNPPQIPPRPPSSPKFVGSQYGRNSYKCGEQGLFKETAEVQIDTVGQRN